MHIPTYKIHDAIYDIYEKDGRILEIKTINCLRNPTIEYLGKEFEIIVPKNISPPCSLTALPQA